MIHRYLKANQPKQLQKSYSYSYSPINKNNLINWKRESVQFQCPLKLETVQQGCIKWLIFEIDYFSELHESTNLHVLVNHVEY